MFLDRFCAKALHVRHPEKVVEVLPSPAKTPDGRPAPALVYAPGRKLNKPKEDGEHVAEDSGAPVKVKASEGAKSSSYRKQKKGTCCVCKALGIKKDNDRYPQTTTVCRHCGGYVHSRGAPGHGECWDYHLCNPVLGLSNSGDMHELRSNGLSPGRLPAGEDSGAAGAAAADA